MRFIPKVLLLCLLALTAASQEKDRKSTPKKPAPAAAKSAATKKVTKPAVQKTQALKPSVQKKPNTPGKTASTSGATKVTGRAAPKTIATKAAGNDAAKKTVTPSAKAVSKAPVKVSTNKAKPPLKPADEQAEWQAAAANTDAPARVASLRKFNKMFPRSAKAADAANLIVLGEAEIGALKLGAGDVSGAATVFAQAAKDAPTPIPEQLFTATLSKFPANLYFRGATEQALEIAGILERKSASNVNQLIGLAEFYVSIENGSEAKRLAEKAIAVDGRSSAAYQMLGLANRLDFQLDASAAGYAKALELDPGSIPARRGLAEMDRSLGKADDAAALYREILAKDENNLPAQTGLILALFDAGKRVDAEALMSKAIETNPGNVILLASAAYWYAANNEGAKAVELAKKAIATDPRYIWSHIALARGYLAQNKAVDAEKTLLAARRYGNFPTLDYEIASAEAAAGFYSEAGENLARNFSVKDGDIRLKLGGRVPRESRNMSELVGFERRASIFAPTAADNPENSARLTALLKLRQQLSSASPDEETLSRAVDDFVRGDDGMKVHRQIFAASQLLEKKKAVAKAAELAKAAVLNVDDGLAVPNAATAVLASELYESRSIAAARGEFISVPEVPRTTLSAILRGRIEEISGWSQYELGQPEEAVTRLKRAVSVLPANSAWWRSSTWRLGSALALTGKDAEALDWYIKSYKGSESDKFRYAVIEALYTKVKGSNAGLDVLLGEKPAEKPDLKGVSAERQSPRQFESTPQATPASVPAKEVAVAASRTTAVDAVPAGSTKNQQPLVPTPLPTPLPSPVVEKLDTAVPSPKPVDEQPQPSAVVSTQKAESAAAERQPSSEKRDDADREKTTPAKQLFAPVVITIPTLEISKPRAKETIEQAPNRTEPAAQTSPCKLSLSDDTVTLYKGGDDVAVVLSGENDLSVDSMTAVSSSPDDVSVRREVIAAVKTRAIFVIHPGRANAGVYQIRFELPCGSKELVVKVR